MRFRKTRHKENIIHETKKHARATKTHASFDSRAYGQHPLQIHILCSTINSDPTLSQRVLLIRSKSSTSTKSARVSPEQSAVIDMQVLHDDLGPDPYLLRGRIISRLCNNATKALLICMTGSPSECGRRALRPQDQTWSWTWLCCHRSGTLSHVQVHVSWSRG